MTRRSIDNLRPAAAVLAAFLLLSCAFFGGGNQEADPGSSAVAPDTPTTVPSQPDDPSGRSPLICEQPPPEELAVGASVVSQLNEPVWTECYWVQVPDGLTSITFSVTGLAADLSLYAGYGYLVTLQFHMNEFWDSTEAGMADEAITLDDPKPGPYFLRVGVAGPKEPSPYELSVTSEPVMTTSVTGAALPGLASCGGPAEVLELGSSTSGEIPAQDERPLAYDYYCVEIPPGTSSFTVELTGLTGLLDLFVRRTTPADWADRSRSDHLLVSVEDPEAGAYYIDVAASLPGSTSPYTLTVNSP